MLRDFEEWLDRWLEEEFDLSDVSRAFIIGFTFVFIGLIIHETAHKLTAIYFGCPASITDLDMYFGSTAVADSCSRNYMMLVSLAGPFAAMIYGLIAWHSGENTISRFMGNIVLAYSVLPNLWPFVTYTDMGKAIQYGLNPIVAYMLWIFPSAYIFWIWGKEVVDRKKFINY